MGRDNVKRTLGATGCPQSGKAHGTGSHRGKAITAPARQFPIEGDLQLGSATL